MKTDRLTPLVIPMNPAERLFVGRVEPRAFVDQRFVSLLPKSNIDLKLLHALLNCTISLFYIESIGFGRGLGALDLSKNRIEKNMFLLDPSLLSDNSKNKIRASFEPLLRRKILPIYEEIMQKDRQEFDEAIINEYGLNVQRERIYTSLMNLFNIRMSALNG